MGGLDRSGARNDPLAFFFGLIRACPCVVLALFGCKGRVVRKVRKRSIAADG